MFSSFNNGLFFGWSSFAENRSSAAGPRSPEMNPFRVVPGLSRNIPFSGDPGLEKLTHSGDSPYSYRLVLNLHKRILFGWYSVSKKVYLLQLVVGVHK